MRIGVICYPTLGGSGILATRLGLELAKKGHEVHFISYEKPLMIPEEGRPNVTFHKVPVYEYPLFKYPPYTMALASEMVRVSREHSLDVVHVHYAIPHSTAALLAKMITRVPYVVTVHGSDVTILGDSASYGVINNHSLEEADALTSVSHYLAGEAKKRLNLRKSVEVVTNFVDPGVFYPAAGGADASGANGMIQAVHVSNFRPVKRIQDLVEAMDIVAGRTDRIRLLLVGEGPERVEIEQLVGKKGLQDKIHFAGYRRDVPDLLRKSQILLLSSENEGFSLTVLEGMACGLPCISTSVGGVPEIVTDGVEGFLVSPHSPQLIAERMLQLGEDEALRRRMGAAGRKTVETRFTPEMVVPRYEEVYRRIVG